MWCGVVWYGMVWYGMVWYGMVEVCSMGSSRSVDEHRRAAAVCQVLCPSLGLRTWADRDRPFVCALPQELQLQTIIHHSCAPMRAFPRAWSILVGGNVCQALLFNNTLSTLSLRFNQIGNRGALALAKTLETNTYVICVKRFMPLPGCTFCFLLLQHRTDSTSHSCVRAVRTSTGNVRIARY